MSLDAKFGDPDFFVCIDTEGRDRIEPQNLGPSKYHWSSSLVDNGQVAIEVRNRGRGRRVNGGREGGREEKKRITKSLTP